ncbi:MAG TPA: GNAT family protein [Bacteroidales bacterium]|nr:GNAT family protein [Bacteroidales bacterium]
MYRSQRITLRPFSEDDAQWIVEMKSEFSDVRSYVGRPYPNDLKGEKEWISRMYHSGILTSIFLAVEENDTRQFVGYVAASNISYINSNATVGVFFHKSGRGKGYYREAQVLFYAYLFNEINLHKLNSTIIPYNEVAIRITAAIGFTTDGIRREQIYQNGKYHDEILISLSRDDFFRLNDVQALVM